MILIISSFNSIYFNWLINYDNYLKTTHLLMLLCNHNNDLFSIISSGIDTVCLLSL